MDSRKKSYQSLITNSHHTGNHTLMKTQTADLQFPIINQSISGIFITNIVIGSKTFTTRFSVNEILFRNILFTIVYAMCHILPAFFALCIKFYFLFKA